MLFKTFLLRFLSFYYLMLLLRKGEGMEVKFYDDVKDELIKFVVIIAFYQGKFVFCKHKDRMTYEFPGGHREDDESCLEAAKRELYEETGAKEFDILPLDVYSVKGKTRVNLTGDESFGRLYVAKIHAFYEKLEYEIESLLISDQLPKMWTYPKIQPELLKYVRNSTDFKDFMAKNC